jgi:hypothetical protein
MNRLLTRSVLVVLVTGALAIPSGAVRAADLPGTFYVFDDANLFSTEAKKQAAKKMDGQKFDHGLHFTVDTYKEMPAEWKKKYDDASDKDKGKVMRDWAVSAATAQKSKGPYVLICMKPGRTVVLADEETTKRGFGQSKEDEVLKIFDTAMRESAKQDGESKTKTRDAALVKATEYIINDLKGTKVVPR